MLKTQRDSYWPRSISRRATSPLSARDPVGGIMCKECGRMIQQGVYHHAHWCVYFKAGHTKPMAPYYDLLNAPLDPYWMIH